ncbi:MAG: hypothetical protein Q9183_002404, partial [Haloplaca sp. 2 TL-2023]
MMAQQASGINIYAFLSTHFYSTLGPDVGTVHGSAVCLDNTPGGSNFTAAWNCKLANASDYDNFLCSDVFGSHRTFTFKEACSAQSDNEAKSFKFAIGFDAANMVSSCLAYFLVENQEAEDAVSRIVQTFRGAYSAIRYFFTGNIHSVASQDRKPGSGDGSQ